MKELDQSVVKEIIEAADFEHRNREYKDAFSWEDKNSTWLKEKCIRAILGLTNTLTGGQLIIGIEEDENHKPIIKGLSDGQLESFSDYEKIKNEIDGFSTSNLNFEMAYGVYKVGDNDSRILFISVEEFEETPTICKKNGQTAGVLIKDDIYSRAKKGSAATIKATDIEIREIIKMAADKEASNLEKRGYIKKEMEGVETYFQNQINDLD